jgi:hypothetical protein
LNPNPQVSHILITIYKTRNQIQNDEDFLKIVLAKRNDEYATNFFSKHIVEQSLINPYITIDGKNQKVNDPFSLNLWFKQLIGDEI